jgi:mono/diheme cytochrome c family protein
MKRQLHLFKNKEMRNILFITVTFTAVITLVSCSNKRKPGSTYMPDMAYSRAYETYMARDTQQFTANPSNTADKIFYNNMPVAGTIARGEELPFSLAKDAPGDTTNYTLSKQIANPLPPLNEHDMKEAERLYLVNCAICHGTALDGNGPLYKGGNGPYPAKPATLVGDPKYMSMPEGQMFYSVTYGKNLMGSYASQLTRKQRWMVIHYIKSKQAASLASSESTAAADSSATK